MKDLNNTEKCAATAVASKDFSQVVNRIGNVMGILFLFTFLCYVALHCI